MAMPRSCLRCAWRDLRAKSWAVQGKATAKPSLPEPGDPLGTVCVPAVPDLCGCPVAANRHLLPGRAKPRRCWEWQKETPNPFAGKRRETGGEGRGLSHRQRCCVVMEKGREFPQRAGKGNRSLTQLCFQVTQIKFCPFKVITGINLFLRLLKRHMSTQTSYRSLLGSRRL